MTQSLNEGARTHIEQVAGNVLAQFEETASVANTYLSNAKDGLTFGALTGGNTFTSQAATQTLRQVSEKNRTCYELLAREPSIARVVVLGSDSQRKTYYFCRAEQGIANLGVVSYLAPIGRLASLPVGEEFYNSCDGTVVEVVERALLRPNAQVDGWDSRDTVVETEDFGPFTIESLRALLTEVVGEEVTEDLLGQLLAEETVKANIINGIRRSVITKMGLRDQPILDQYQDEIFRLPLDKRLLILGPPGTGKTTTLIRRLGQKLDTAFLDEGEQRLVETVATAQGIPHANSWLMFTPTELLKQYLKEAFVREGVPASNDCISTWHDYRRELARKAFGILRTASGSGTFVLKEGLNSLSEAALEHPIQWFDDFDAWQRKVYVQELHDAAARLHDGKTPEVRSLGAHLQDILSGGGDRALGSMFGSLAREIAKVQALRSEERRVGKEC